MSEDKPYYGEQVVKCLPFDFKSIPAIKSITIGDIETTEKVLKFCAEANGINIDHFSVIMFMRKTVNILRWMIGAQIKDLEFPGFIDDMYVLCIVDYQLAIVRVAYDRISSWESYSGYGYYEILRIATPNEMDKYPMIVY